ncbi:MAG: hypothetical protein ACRDYC_13415 [Acidimicrobiales bacterium]
MGMVDRLPADPSKLLEAWMEWERGDTPPGRTMATLKTGGLPALLRSLVETAPEATEPPESSAAEEGVWVPVV